MEVIVCKCYFYTIITINESLVLIIVFHFIIYFIFLHCIFAILKICKGTKSFKGRKIIKNHLQRLLLPKQLNLTKILGGLKNLLFVSNLDLPTSGETHSYLKSPLEGQNINILATFNYCVTYYS